MINLPNFDDSFDYENNFYLSCESSRIAKMLAHFKFLEMTVETEGEIVECGVFKGASFSRFAMYRKILNIESYSASENVAKINRIRYFWKFS